MLLYTHSIRLGFVSNRIAKRSFPNLTSRRSPDLVDIRTTRKFLVADPVYSRNLLLEKRSKHYLAQNKGCLKLVKIHHALIELLFPKFSDIEKLLAAGRRPVNASARVWVSYTRPAAKSVQ